MKQNILKFNFKFKSSEFFVTEKNMFAYNFIKKWPDWQQTLVYLYGPEKCGKTTISQMWLEASKGIYLSSENFEEFFSDDLNINYIKSNNWLIDNVDDLITKNKELNSTKILNFINIIQDNKNAFLLMTGKKSPKHIDCDLNDLTLHKLQLKLAKEIAKTGKPIMLKRHYVASLRDWLGAAEYILLEGNEKVILCERGVSSPHTHRSTSRFMLDVQAIVALKELVKYPIISDPSHASFWAPWVPSLVYSSIAAGCDGSIIEMHPDPKNSAVDPLQPLNFKKFKEVIIKSRKISKFFNKKIL